ncbi:teichuronic acid biosynthesis glycosyltransferase TuaH [Microbacterium resistens]|uniref:Teichuronic acid biosynthesis glycosyltransferase TuaH n=1 Tax=Microbacterium resistens TaxID=156977 RepID=A0ABU1SDB7_9MICO|nr:glycosyltransferase [Microbacterium resistens]MDR6867243.1 teichuronic acid biosynthesis glycosyltransferase TuaH [Microbacterium resistens]
MSSIVFFSHTARAGDFRVGSHHLSSAFAAMGHRVAHISTPFSWAHAALKPGQGARRRAAFAGPITVDGVTDLIPTPIVPANVRWTQRQTDRALARVGIPHPDVVFVDQPLFPVTHFGPATVIFRPTDVFAAEAIQRAAVAAARDADGIAATSPGVLASVIGESTRPTLVLENGVEFSKFASAARTESEKEYDFVYVGALDFRFDFALLAQAARAMPSSVFAIFGPLPDAGLDLPSNVQFRGPVPYESVPSVMARGRAGLMPFVDNPSNAARSPMKLYEYVAAGVPAVVPEAVAARATGLRGLDAYVAGDPESFVAALKAALARRGVLDEADRESARVKDWRNVAEDLLAFALSCERAR